MIEHRFEFDVDIIIFHFLDSNHVLSDDAFGRIVYNTKDADTAIVMGQFANNSQWFKFLAYVIWSAAYNFYHIALNMRRNAVEKIAIENRAKDLELINLRSQLNPHFLFNTLNNLNTLITVDSNKASAVVLGLSDVLRYQLYEADENKVLLKKDIEILRQFLELEKIRRDNFQFSIKTEGDIAAIFIPPFIFINFVENAIKHSVDNTGFSYISLDFNVAGSHLYFTCKNSKPSTIKVKVNGGLGLQNIKRRLELMYEDKFTLETKDDEKEFLIALALPL